MTREKKGQSTEIITQPIRIARVKIEGASPITWGKFFTSVKEADEPPDAFDARCWRERGHYDEQGRMVIPADMIHKSLIAAGSWLSEKMRGRGQATFKKRVAAGVRCTKNALITPVRTMDQIPCWAGMVPSQPAKPTEGRVLRRFPLTLLPWAAELEIWIVDGLIENDVFTRHMKASGMFDGYGTHRPGSPRCAGPNGTFTVTDVRFEELSL